MTRSTNARIAGATYLLYIALAAPTMAMSNGPAASALNLLASVNALFLAVSLYAITRDVDQDLALVAMVCRVGEGVLGAASTGMVIGGFFFAVGSTIFCWLLLRGRMIPLALAWLGLVASVLLVIALPLQLGGIVHGAAARVVWIPMAAFEIPLGVWFLIKGVRPASVRSDRS